MKSSAFSRGTDSGMVFALIFLCSVDENVSRSSFLLFSPHTCSMPNSIVSNFANSPSLTCILFVLETHLPSLSFLESPLTEAIEAWEVMPKPGSLTESQTVFHVMKLVSLLIRGSFPIHPDDFLKDHTSNGSGFSSLQNYFFPYSWLCLIPYYFLFVSHNCYILDLLQGILAS